MSRSSTLRSARSAATKRSSGAGLLLVLTAGAVHIGLDNSRLLAGILGGAIAWRTRNTLLTIIAGMLALHLFGYLLK